MVREQDRKRVKTNQGGPIRQDRGDKTGNTIYKVTLKMTGDDFNFEWWSKDNRHFTNPAVVLVNNTGYITQK